MEMTIEQQRAFAMSEANKRASQANAGASPLSQFLSGANEGVAGLLSLPNTIEMGARSIGPAVGNLMGGDFAMPTESLLPDAGASYSRFANGVGAVKPETKDPAGQFARRVGQEVGASILPVAAGPAKVAGALSAVGSGVGAAAAQQFAPDNAMAELAGQVAGGGGFLAVTNALERRAATQAAVPTVEGLKADAGALYDQARASGAVAPQQATRALDQMMKGIATSEGLISPTGRVNPSYPRINGILNAFEDYANGPMDITQAQATRRVLTDAAKSAEPGEKRIATIMLEQFDKFLDPLAPQIAQANQIYSRAKKGEFLEQAIELAGSRAGQFSGSGFENALRTEFRSIERQIIKGQIRGLSDGEIDAIEKVARGGPIENALRFVGKFAPTGNVSTVLGGSAGFALGGPLGGAAVLGAGAAGRNAATKMATNNARQAVVEALMGGNSVKVPAITENTMQAAGRLGIGQAANQNNPQDQVVRALLRVKGLN